MKVAFLFGSGISLKAGYPRVSNITEIVLSGEGISRHTDSEYYFIKPLYGLEEDENVNRIVSFLSLINKEVTTYYADNKLNQIPNYEDFYYYVRQMHDEIYGEQENSIVFKYIQTIKSNKAICLKAKNKLFNDFKFEDLINETMTYINNIVTRMLYQPKDDISYLKLFQSLNTDEEIESSDFFSLNHDLLLEKYFSENKINFCDGFDERKGDIRNFNIRLYDSENKLKLYKLHGSIDWHKYREENKDWRGDFIGKPVIDDIHHTKDENGKFINPIDNKSKILIGTFNKLIDYNSGIFSDLFHLFSSKLKQNNLLIISGYGFSDKGINTKIMEWYYTNDENKILLIHKNSNSLKEKARGAVSNKWDLWIKEKRLIIIEKWFQDVIWEELKSLLK